jgi:flagellar motor switch protein FliN
MVDATNVAPTPPTAQPEPLKTPVFEPPPLPEELSQLSLLDDVELDVRIELGRTQMYIEDVLRLGVGSVIELDKLAGDPVDVYINNRHVARGEVLVLNDNLCVRINEIVSQVPEFEGMK